MAKHMLVVLTNATEGEDEEFNRWYSGTHLRDILTKLDGFAAAQRFELSEVSGGQSAPYRYLAIYEVEDDRVADSHGSLVESRAERSEALQEGREPLVPISPTLDDDRQAWFFSAISDRLTKEDVEGSTEND